MNQKQIETRSLIVSSVMNFIIGAVGLVVYIITNLNFLLLDSVISIIAFLSSLAAYFISKNSYRKTDAFPKGLHFLEPLYALIRSIVTVTLLLITLLETSASAFAYFVHGEGQPVTTGIVFPYSVVMIFLCYSLYFYNKLNNKKIGNMSIIIEAESKGNFIDGTISVGITLAMVLLYIIDIDGPLGFLHYTGDFFITASLVAFSIKEPIVTIVASFRELSYSVVRDQAIENSVISIIQVKIPTYAENFEVHVFKQGTHIRIQLLIDPAKNVFSIEQLIELKEDILVKLQREFQSIELDFVV